MSFLGLGIGVLFGAALFLSGLANPDKIIGTLRLKDLHAMRAIAVFVIVGMVGVFALDLAGMAHFSVKPAAVLSILVGGGLLGAGFGLTGYCPGTGLACAATGRVDALVSVGGMLLGALVFVLVHPYVAVPLDGVMNLGKEMLPEATGIPRSVWVGALGGGGALALYLTRPGRRAGSDGAPVDAAARSLTGA